MSTYAVFGNSDSTGYTMAFSSAGNSAHSGVTKGYGSTSGMGGDCAGAIASSSTSGGSTSCFSASTGSFSAIG